MLARIRFMLSEAKLDDSWWSEAAVNAIYVTNRVPQRGQVATLDQALHGKKPDVGHLRVFVCKARADTPAHIRRKLEVRAMAGIFLGYGKVQLGYRVRIGTGIVTRRDVHFDESTTPGTVLTAPAGNDPVTVAQGEVNNDSESADTRDTSLAEVDDASPEDMRRCPSKGTSVIEDAVAPAQRLVR